MSPALEIQQLTVTGPSGPVVQGVGFRLEAGECLTVLGESGSGKSIMAQAIMGTLPIGLRMGGEVSIWGQRTQAEHLPALWGRQIAMLPQEPWLALNPSMRLQAQVAEVPFCVLGQPWPDAQAQAAQALQQLQLDPARRKYPHQISGGMAQRVAFAATCAAGAKLLIADEPTKGLDASLRDRVGALLAASVKQDHALLTITHDVALARLLGGTVAIMLHGEIVEQGPASRVLSQPEHPYSQALVQAQAEHWPALARPFPGDATPVLRAKGLSKSFGKERLFTGLDLEIAPGEIVAISGPSGCGKSTLGHILLGLLPPDQGVVQRRSGARPHAFQKLYQDPPAAFAPERSVGQSLEDLIRLHKLSRSDAQQLMGSLKLDPALLQRRPGDISGGELQRFALLRILLLKPDFVFADEPTSRLDPITQRNTMQLLCDSAAAHRLAVVLVSHDAALLAKASHRRAEMGFS